MDYQASLTHFEEAKALKALISPRTGCLFTLMKYTQNTYAKKVKKLV